MPTLERTSYLFNVLALVNKRTNIMHRVQARLLDGVVGNRAKLNYLKLIWEEQKDKLCFQYIQKNKKKEYNQIIGDISGIDMSVRDAFLTRYLSRCKLTHSLAFF